MRRSDVEAVARSWVGTPFHHQQSVKGVGCDCVGLINGVGIECAIIDFTPAKWARFEGYSRRPRPEQLLAYSDTFLHRIDVPTHKIAPRASIGLIAWRPGEPLHFAIRARADDGRPTIIHALDKLKAAVEHGFVDEWPDMIDSWWAFPGIED